LFAHVSHAAAGVNQTLSFQGRLLQSSGAVVPDGHYNIQFKIYQDGDGSTAGDTGGTLKWTESYVNNNSNSGVEVTDGFFSVNLGSLNPFGTQVDWNQDTLWLSMNVAGSANTCTAFNGTGCTADGEMTPMKRITSTPYALNSGQLGGKTADNFVQLAQGVQDDTSDNTSSIYLNKTGSGGSFAQFQNAGADVLTISNYGDIAFGAATDPDVGAHLITVADAPSDTIGTTLGIRAGNGGDGSGSTGGETIIGGGNGGGTNGNGGLAVLSGGSGTGTGTGGSVYVQGGGSASGTAGSVYVGSSNTSAIYIGNSSSSDAQSITIGNNGGSTSSMNITIGSDASAGSGTTSIQSKNDTTVTTNGTQQARFSGSSNTLYVGNADTNGQAVTANNYTIQGTSSTGSNVQGGNLTLQAGSATNGNANGGNLVLSAGAGSGTGTTGLVTLNTPTFQTAATQTCSSTPCTITQSNVDSYAVIVLNTSGAGYTISLPDPTLGAAAYGRILYITSASTDDFTLAMNGGGSVSNQVAMRNNTTATLIWGPNGWTAAGASNATTLQTAYDNTLQSSGGAELIVSKTSSTNGLTIRDSLTNSVNGTLLQVQSKTAANLFSVSSNVSDYASDNGAEVDNGSGGFPSSTWASTGSATVTRNTTTTDESIATGQASVKAVTTGANGGITNQIVDPTAGTATTLNANTLYSVSFSTRLPANATATFNTMSVLYKYDSSGDTVPCTTTNQQVLQTSWKKIDCTFTAPASGIDSTNAILIKQTDSTARTFYVDNLSVTLAASQNYAADGGVDSAAGTNWVAVGGDGTTASQSTTNGYTKSDSIHISTVGATGDGVKNNLAVNPIPSNNYRVSVEVQTQTTALTGFKVQYTYDGTHMTDCVDYSTQAVIASMTNWYPVTCIIQVPSNIPTAPAIIFTQGDASTRTDLYLDSFSMTLATSTTPDVQVGSGSNGGPVTLFTLDSSASAPIEDGNSALYGSMYYDTTLGKIQCYQQSGWGSCGAAPDNIITISPEYNNAVMHGSGIGTMTSDFCSDSLDINDATHGTPICGTNQTYNFYRWTSPQSAGTKQTYSIYVTYQLPSTFKSFNSGTTYVTARTDDGSNGGYARVQYTIYKNNGSGLTECDTAATPTVVSHDTQTAWTVGTAVGTMDPSTCGFAANDSVVFKIDMTADANANAYVSNLGFAFSNQ